jgi:hypothetical protein
MSEAQTKHETIFIKRYLNTWDGKTISYLKSSPFALETDFSELVMNTIRSRWLPLVLLKHGEHGDKLKQTGVWAITQLESQISIIRQICGIEAHGAAHPVIMPIMQAQSSLQGLQQVRDKQSLIENQVYEKDETLEDEDDFMDLELTEQMSKNLKRFGGS